MGGADGSQPLAGRSIKVEKMSDQPAGDLESGLSGLSAVWASWSGRGC